MADKIVTSIESYLIGGSGTFKMIGPDSQLNVKVLSIFCEVAATLTTLTHVDPAGVGTFEYRLDGLGSVANVGRTSGVVRTQAISGITTTNPSYGLYVWRRTS